LREKNWFEEFEYLRKYAEQKGHVRVPKNYVTGDGFNLGTWVSRQRSAYRGGELSVKAKNTLEGLLGWTWDLRQLESEMSWSRAFEYLLKYVEQKGHARVPKGYITENGFKLGVWVAMQRSAYRNRELSSKAKKSLEELPDWIWDIRKFESEMNWFKAFEHLRTYVEKEGHARVPTKYITQDGYPLGVWFGAQRSAYRRGELPIKMQKALETLPNWTWKVWKGKSGEEWLEGFKQLRKYVKAEGHSLVPGKYVTEGGYHLRAWVNNQRQAYKQGALRKNRQEKFERLKGWVWSVNEARWIEGFKYLREYVEREGNALVPRRYVQKNGYKLGLWVMAQRQLYQQKRLPKKRQRALEQLSDWVWNPRKGPRKAMTINWVKSWKRLRQYVERAGHARVPQKYVTQDGYKLGRWITDQRYEYKRRRLSLEQQEALEQLPGWVWSVNEARWIEGFKYLREYVEREGYAQVPQQYVTEDGYKLGTWVRDQRYEYRKGRLSVDQQVALEQLPGWEWSLQNSRGKSKV